ncbi:MAG: enoyl-[acyl-carrier protein] reductase II [Patiriisocius sp.]
MFSLVKLLNLYTDGLCINLIAYAVLLKKVTFKPLKINLVKVIKNLVYSQDINIFTYMNKINQLLGIQYPIIQGGMIWNSGWKLASAVSNQGGLGLIGAGSMYPDVLIEHIDQCKEATSKNFGVNIPLLYPQVDDLIQIIIDKKVPVVFSSAGNPKKYTQHLKDNGIKVVHVVSSLKFALKAEAAGVDAVVAEGFEAGGHNGREETTTMCLIPMIADKVNIPLISAGGIASGRSMLAAMNLGADAVQIGSLFAASHESSSHNNFKERIKEAKEGGTSLTLKELTPVRLMASSFLDKVNEAYAKDASTEELKELLGRGRAKKGMFEGDMEEGELEIGQVSAQINDIRSIEEIFSNLISEYYLALKRQQIDSSFVF